MKSQLATLNQSHILHLMNHIVIYLKQIYSTPFITVERMRLELGLDIKTIYFNARNLRNKLDEV